MARTDRDKPKTEAAKNAAPPPEVPQQEVPQQEVPKKEAAPPASPADALLARLELAEQANGRLRRENRLVLALALIAALFATTALLAPYNGTLRLALDRIFRRGPVAASQKVVLEAQQLLLRGPDGEVRADLAPRAEGGIGLNLYDQEGKVRADLGIDADGTGALRFAGEDGRPGLALSGKSLRLTDRDGAAVLSSTSLGLTAWEVRNARSGVWLGARPDGSSALTLADSSGKTRVAASVKSDGVPNLTLFDREAKQGAVLDVPTDGARLGLFAGGLVQAGMGISGTGTQMGLYGADGSDRVTLRNLADGSTGLYLADEEGKERVAMGVRPNGPSGLSLLDKKGVHRAAVSVRGDGSAHLEIYDTGGVRRARVGLGSDGTPGVQLEDRGQVRAVLGGAPGDRARTGGGASSLVLYDKDGTILFQAPLL